MYDLIYESKMALINLSTHTKHRNVALEACLLLALFKRTRTIQLSIETTKNLYPIALCALCVRVRVHFNVFSRQILMRHFENTSIVNIS